ncbi:3-keto-5-aminohexanoate cleavage protein [Octadecabacter sp. G9-8]|uniref:3-keto-5-aminohexanoate cleavage protein n=1 Tax=Octadecabacter dasysiphoniae TaxID=2909341 RepID=A0ABS9D0C1_9RHOB|nr:3-keto-5-aminohexanoate cleavage protein [Octadecabacter dasysiphoniae]MCF2872975.1 3-keto-5-aminohexanoate cleavage protein [Octadecabacter dasysiphoniae]
MQTPYILVAPTGARRTKQDHPNLPIQMDEIIQSAAACFAAGAHGLHLHVRDDAGQHTLDPGIYRETLAELETHLPDMGVQITTEAAGVFDVATQLACLDGVKPRWASISVREIARDPALADRVYGTCVDNGTKVQHILYDVADVALLADWHSRGIVRADQTSVIFVLGRYTTGQVSHPSDLTPFLETFENRGPWMVCAFGQNEHACLHAAAQHGGDLRVGFENNLLDGHGAQFTDNAASVNALADTLKAAP